MEECIALPVKVLHPALGVSIPLPARMSTHAAGYDICAAVDEPLVLLPGQRRLIPTGFALAVPVGYEAQIRPRSGLALKHGVTVLNSPGTIDADYRGEVKVLLINLGEEPFQVTPGMRMAQMVLAAHQSPDISITLELDETPRGGAGYGSTGT
jgi:dUTP pyrophosphatase